jgi:lipopolysaccharide biosynthesis glycosyltransferase
MVYAFFILVHSLVSNATKPFSLVVGHFTGRLSQEHQALIRDFAKHWGIPFGLRELTPNPLFTERRHLTITTFSKFVISDEIPDPHLWIDLDTLAREGWDEFFANLYAAPASAGLVVAEKLQSPHTRFEGFNAGILGWTGKPRADWLPALASLPEKRFSSEQFLFNTLYADSAHAIDVKFNFLSSWHAQTSELERSAIIHYSGPVKPWHLTRRHRKAWTGINPSWEYWFDAESKLLVDLKDSTLEEPVKRLRRQALFSGRLHTGKGALAGWVMRFLAVAGPLGSPIVSFLKSRTTL